MSTQIVSMEEMKKSLIGGETGNEAMSVSRSFPPVINILQSEKQNPAFVEFRPVQELLEKKEKGEQLKKEEEDLVKSFAGEMAMSQGKLFIRNDSGNTLKDLKSSLTVTLLKSEMGYEIREWDEAEKKDRIIGSGKGMMLADDKVDYLDENPTHKVMNMVKLVVTTCKTIEEIEEMKQAGQNPFALLVFKGASYGVWFDVQKEMNAVSIASSEWGNAKAADVKACAFRLIISSEKQFNNRGQEFYVPRVTVGLNKMSDAFQFVPVVEELKSFSLFYKVAEAVKAKEAVKSNLPENPRLDKDFQEAKIVDEDLKDVI